jgi:very-short-patch-repair endonuclease
MIEKFPVTGYHKTLVCSFPRTTIKTTSGHCSYFQGVVNWRNSIILNPQKMTQSQIHNRNEFEDRRKHLRKTLTSAEATLWTLLKGKQLDGRKFRRQHGVDKFVLDFYCSSEKLAIELDGEHHFTDNGMAYDEKRTKYLNDRNILVLRFENKEVFNSPEGVLAEIKRHFKSR